MVARVNLMIMFTADKRLDLEKIVVVFLVSWYDGRYEVKIIACEFKNLTDSEKNSLG